MREIEISADDLTAALLNLPAERRVCLLDSCGVPNLGSRFLIAGFDAAETLEINEPDAEKTLAILDEKLSRENLAAIFTISYEFGLKLNRIKPRAKEFFTFDEPDVFIALFDCLIIHDYKTGKTFLAGDEKRFDDTEKSLFESLENAASMIDDFDRLQPEKNSVSSNFTRENYIRTIEEIQEFIRRGDTYQTNLTQQFRVSLPENFQPERIFFHLRKNHPAPFAAFLRRENDVVVSASPERFLKIENGKRETESAEAGRKISASPIKGTRRRGETEREDSRLRTELLQSEKDRAENVMIVDLLRNDLGRICDFGSVAVEKLCDLETHPTLFHLVSTMRGRLREGLKFSHILQAAFPSGSITGAPKIRTMQIIDRLETAPRGLSMGAIGLSIQNGKRKMENIKNKLHHSPFTADRYLDLSVAIRTMVVRGNEAVFNVGGGITIDSIPEDEYEESLLKAKALLNAINAEIRILFS